MAGDCEGTPNRQQARCPREPTGLCEPVEWSKKSRGPESPYRHHDRLHRHPRPLADPTYLAEVTTDPETGTITWPNGADLDPNVLYAAITGMSVEQHLASAEAS